MKITPTEEHNRFLLVTKIPTHGKYDLSRMNIEIRYTEKPNEGNKCSKAIALDNEVIPMIITAVNCHDDLVKVLKGALKHMGESNEGECEMCGGTPGGHPAYHKSCACFPIRVALKKAGA